jgi:NAD(P)-dependent dehydrogenase (short-subunit alcohol dehydrogenase family)
MSENSFNLQGKVALVTGGNGGIGLGMAEAMARAGADICIWGTNATKNTEALKTLSGHGVKTMSLQCDVSRKVEVDASFAETLQSLGRVDGVFANAGMSGNENSFLEITEEKWRRMLGVNLDGVFFTYQAALRHMLERAENGDPGGRLIATSSMASISGAARNEHYAATKGGLNAMSYALAVEFGRYGITSNIIQPGWVATNMTEGLMANEKFATNASKRIPLRRWGQPRDFGGLAVYLLSDSSAYHTGQDFLIDGGYWRF